MSERCPDTLDGVQCQLNAGHEPPVHVSGAASTVGRMTWLIGRPSISTSPTPIWTGPRGFRATCPEPTGPARSAYESSASSRRSARVVRLAHIDWPRRSRTMSPAASSWSQWYVAVLGAQFR